MGDLITQAELAERLGVSRQAIQYYRRSNKGGINAYFKGKRIDSTILTQEPYKTLTERHKASQDAQPPAAAKEIQRINALRAEDQQRIADQEQTITDLRSDLDRLQSEKQTALEQLHAAQAEIRLHEQTIAHQEQRIADKQAEIDRLRADIDAERKLYALTLAALPAPRKTFGERFRELFGIKTKDQTDA